MKKSIACVLLSAMVAFGSFAAGCGGNSQQAEKKTFTIAYAPNESTTDSTDARSTLAKDLGKVINMEVKEIQASDYTAIIEALRTGKADMAYMGALAVAMGSERAGVTPIVMKAPNGDKAQAVYHSVFVTQKDNNEINSIKDFKGKTIAFVDPDSTSGNLVPTSEIMKAFPDLHLTNEKIHTNGEFFEAVSFSGKHQAGLQAVIKGDVDIVPISDQIMASEFKNGNADENAVKVVHSSAAIPAEAMVVSKTVNEDLKKTLTKFLVEYNNKDYFDKVIKKADARFVECSMEDYQPIVELNKNINTH
ncbi:phosphate/phosphite/phosphonate ABC transporter substrate-binding protein [Phascolarctobacterium sp. ET69]|uniref:phosphate/phosphite/phosphonate ABC transporter substrate-binding protein n=1 Tax=Phascolarctobacterium sp. ET69 TaxID=2939420 RepID=UPI00201392F7|nr:phosphate/phosphite/phosphonate ABC transporter substrate-binding protein [Phascolarctobacterium sp. ET69]MCL1605397.1 phosphate/phosphite/phosphonate ABC transporter substrate-binding protein [Phascolarctobacterium sp. ET69]